MADKKISALTAATLPLAGTELLPIVQSSTTDNITVNNLAAGNLKSQSTTGVLQVSGPAAGATRVMTIPNANFTAARTDAAQTFTGTQVFSSLPQLTAATANRILYADGSQVMATSTYMQFDGTKVQFGQGTFSVGDNDVGLTVTGGQRTNFKIASTETDATTWTFQTAGAGNYGSGAGNLYLGSGAAASFILQTKTGSGESLRVFGSGGMSIGNTTDPGAGNLSVSGFVYLSATAKGLIGSSAFSVQLTDGATGTLLDLSTAMATGQTGIVNVCGASAGKATILVQRDQGGYYSATELGTQPRGTYITSIAMSGSNLQIKNSTGGTETFSGHIVLMA